ncbi:hypothetical protein ACFV2Z_34400 [Streptomyces sp. NPDC059688]|uniref:hypothetical protein n=1 Tax=Streptomyces sp. NPDC059688 TaxID=3346906 RepID=UPI0036C1717B
MTAMPAEANFSDLINKPKDTVARMQGTVRQGIRLHRRGEADLYLTTAERADQVTELVGTTARILVVLLREKENDQRLRPLLVKTFREAFPWVHFLPAAAIREFLTEFADTARAAAELGSVAPLAPVIASWKATAEAYSDPELAKSLLRPTEDDFGTAEEPPAE